MVQERSDRSKQLAPVGQERPDRSHGLVRTAKYAGWTMLGPVGAGIISETIHIIPQALSNLTTVINHNPEVSCLVGVGVVGGFVAVLEAFSHDPNTPPRPIPRRVDLTGFSGGHISHSVSIAPDVDEEAPQQ